MVTSTEGVADGDAAGGVFADAVVDAPLDTCEACEMSGLVSDGVGIDVDVVSLGPKGLDAVSSDVNGLDAVSFDQGLDAVFI